jgi:hypothetical protein
LLVLLKPQKLVLSDSELALHREALYGDGKPGYTVLKQYLTTDEVAHLHQVWKKNPPDPACFDTVPREPKLIGQRPFAFFGNRRTCYYNYLWNKPIDEFSHTLCFSIALLRNQLQQTPLYFNLAPNGRRLASYRLILSDTYKEGDIEVQPHQDFSTEKYKTEEPESQLYLQATLFLSEYGVDYTGRGFYFTTNQGEKLYLGRDLDIKPGDLMIWRYINVHGVDDTQALPGGMGFMRMVFPHEDIDVSEIRIKKPSPLKRLAQRFIPSLKI